MDFKIENDYLTVLISDVGAELQSIVLKKTGNEHLWQGDEKYWGRRAPLLFPIVGKLKNDTMTYDGWVYHMTQHGFARDLHFEAINYTNDSVIFTCSSSSATQIMYPFEWTMTYSYHLEGNVLKTSVTVVNTSDSDTMYFSIGFHPGFILPMDEGLAFDDYLLYFNKDHSAKRWKVEGTLIGDQESTDTISNHQVQLSHALFETDALVFKGLKSDEIIIKNLKTDSSLHFKFQNFPFLGIWTKPGAPYLCLEPWHGIADSKYHKGDFVHKEGIEKLDGGMSFSCGYAVEIIT